MQTDFLSHDIQSLKNKLLSTSLDEKVAEDLFWKLRKKIESLHMIGLFNIDLSLDNILLDVENNLKFASLDSAKVIQRDRERQNALIKEDIFNLGMVLLQMVTGKCDFERKLLKIIQKGHFDYFWKVVEMQNNQKFSKELKELINMMLTIKRSHRKEKLTIREIFINQSRGQNGTFPTIDNINNY